MTALPHTSGDGGAGREPKAISSSRTDQHQMKADAARGNARGVMRRLTPAAHKAQARRLGRGDAPRSLSHCRSASTFLLPVLGRGRMLTTSWVSGLHSPAERIRAARGAFLFMCVSDCRPTRAQSLRDKPAYQVAIAEIHHHSNLSLGLTDLAVSSEPKGLGNVRKAFGELRNV